MKPTSIFTIIFAFFIFSFQAQETPITPEGRALSAFLDSLRVEELWQASRRVNWLTGEPKTGILNDGKPHTHCSAFVAAAAYKLNIYILRPPDHSETLLANAQFDWLGQAGKAQGWLELESGLKAQGFANQGFFVVAVYKSRKIDASGHIAIIRPENKTEELILKQGPQLIQAGMKNHRSTSLHEGFKQHPLAFKPGKIRFFAHAVDPTWLMQKTKIEPTQKTDKMNCLAKS
jgi:hypothetical protein